jgi:hypothetical protein
MKAAVKNGGNCYEGKWYWSLLKQYSIMKSAVVLLLLFLFNYSGLPIIATGWENTCNFTTYS